MVLYGQDYHSIQCMKYAHKMRIEYAYCVEVFDVGCIIMVRCMSIII